jgi:hypothetical protein
MATNASDIAPPPLRCISKKTSLVRPVSPSPAKDTTIPLTVVDRISIGIFTPAILLYSEPEDGHHHQRDFPAAVRKLEESLAEVLVEFYPLAGRLVKGAQGLPEVRCDDAGAIFTEAVAEETFEEAGGMDALPRVTGMDATGLGDKPRYSIQQHDELPILVVQVSKCSSSVAREVLEHNRSKPNVFKSSRLHVVIFRFFFTTVKCTLHRFI